MWLLTHKMWPSWLEVRHTAIWAHLLNRKIWLLMFCHWHVNLPKQHSVSLSCQQYYYHRMQDSDIYFIILNYLKNFETCNLLCKYMFTSQNATQHFKNYHIQMWSVQHFFDTTKNCSDMHEPYMPNWIYYSSFGLERMQHVIWGGEGKNKDQACL